MGMLQHVQRTVFGYFITGLLAWIPLIVTVWIVRLLINNQVLGIERLARDVLRYMRGVGDRVPTLSFLTEFKYQPGIGVTMVVIIFLLTGILTQYLLGRRLIGAGERILARIPLISRIYRAVRQIRDVFMGRGGAVFQKVCLVEYPRPGLVAVAFVTSSEHGVVQEAMNKELIAVFVPTTPNPTSGYLVYLPPNEVKYLDITVEEAMKLVVSGGAYIPGSDEDDLDARTPVPSPAPDAVREPLG